MPAVRSAAVLMPIYQGARYLDRVLAALEGQRTGLDWSFLALDCGSTDGTLEIFARRARSFPVPLQVRGVRKEEFNHGCTRNLLAALSDAELLVFLTDDAIPLGEGWLERLARNFDDPTVGAAYCRNVTRPDADALVRVQNASDPTYDAERREQRLPDAERRARMSHEELRALYNYCDSASAMRRELWERHPYPRCTFGEDFLMARALLHAGATIVFDVDAAVEHSHDYDVEATARRGRLDGQCNAEWLGRVAVPTRKTAERLARRVLREDRRALEREGLRGAALAEALARARALRRALFLGLYEGARTRKRCSPTALLASPGVRALTVVGAGADADVARLAAQLADELRGLGHEVELAREEELGELGARLDQVRPALVHFHAPAAASIPALDAVLERGIPLLAHLHDLPADEAREELLYACRSAALALAATRALQGRLIAEASFEPVQLVYSPSPEREPDRTRALAEHALELCFRYRALASSQRGGAPGVLLERRGAACAMRAGDARERFFGALLLGPGHGAATLEIELPPAFGEEFELDLYVGCTGLAAGTLSAGRVLVDGEPRGRLGPLRSLGRGETHVLTLSIGGGDQRRRVVVENRPRASAAAAWLRIERWVVRRRPARSRWKRDIVRKLRSRAAAVLDRPPRLDGERVP